MSLEKLEDFHKSLGGIISDKGSVLKYKGDPEVEYNAVRTGIGIFDYTQMNIFSIKGEGAADFLNSIVCGNVQFLEFYHILFTSIFDMEGRIVDLLYVFRTMDGFIINGSISQKEKVFSIFEKHKPENVEIIDENNKFAVISLEGVYSWEVAKEMAGIDVVGLRYLGFFNTSFKNIPEIYCARCGVTGEYGFRFIIPIENVVEFLEYLKNFKTERSMEFCGIEILSLLSQEVRFQIFGIGIYEGDSPIEKGLSWMIDWRKENYLGKEAIDRSLSKFSRKMVGFTCAKGYDSIKPGDKVFLEDEEIGEVIINTYSFKLGVTIGYVFLNKEWACVGISEYHIENGEERVNIKTVSTAFFLTESIKVQMV